MGQGIKCGDIHGSNCACILESNWRFCPQCGSIAGGVKLPTVQAITSSLPSVVIEVIQVGPEPVTVQFYLKAPNGYERRINTRQVKGSQSLEVVLKEGEAEIDGLMLTAVVEDSYRPLISESDVAGLSGIWQPREPTSKVTYLRRQADVQHSIQIEPELIFLHQGRASAKVAFRAQTPHPVPISPPTSTGSVFFQPDGRIPRTLDSREPLRGTVSAMTFGEGEIGTISMADASASVIGLKPAKTVRSPVYRISIDFGTSGTSVVIRSHRVKWFATMAGESARFPSAVLLRQGSTRLYGQEAIDKYLSTGGRGSFLVTELKKLLQTEDEMVPGTRTSIDELLAWYLRQILQDVILPKLKSLEDGGSIEGLEMEFVFTLPVLDGAESRAQYERRMRQAVEAAEFPQYGQVHWLNEPESALLSLIFAQGFDEEAEPEGASKLPAFADHDRVLVFDSGGGTTDICTATVVYEAGRFRLTNVKSASLELNELKAEKKVISRDFGGTTVTQTLGALLYLDAGDTSKTAFRALLKEDHRQEEFPVTRLNWVGEPRPWFHTFGQFYHRLENAKRTLCSSDADRANIVQEGMPLHRAHLDECIDILLADLDEKLIKICDDAFGRGVRPNVVVCVGGNSFVSQIPEAVQRVLHGSSMVRLSSKIINCAVAFGGVCLGEVLLPPLPYDLEVVDEQRDEAILDIKRDNPMEKSYANEHVLEMPPGGEHQFGVYALHGEKRGLQKTVVIRNPWETSEIITTQFLMEGGRLRVRAYCMDKDEQVYAEDLDL